MYSEVEVKLNLKRKWMDAHIKPRKEQKLINKKRTAWRVKIKRVMYDLVCFYLLLYGRFGSSSDTSGLYCCALSLCYRCCLPHSFICFLILVFLDTQ